MSDELFDSFDGSQYRSGRRQKSVAADVQQSELTFSYDELNEARQQLRLLEMKIQTLEKRIARKYPDVLFLNYKNRMRILVTIFPIFSDPPQN